MDRQQENFENYLREFEPRRLRPLPTRHDFSRVRIVFAVAAIVMLCIGGLWLTSRKPGTTTQDEVSVRVQNPLVQQGPSSPPDPAPLASEKPGERESIRTPQTTPQNRPGVAARNQPAQPVAFSPQALTRLALEKPEEFERELTAASRNILPRFDGSDSTLRGLAGE